MNKTSIQEYIKANPDCKIPNTVSLTLKGQREDLPAYKIPLEMTFYNIKNGRFAAEYRDKVREHGRELDPTQATDSKEIQEMLLGLDRKASQELQQDLQKSGQMVPGIITHDGYVINGNRRRAVLERLVSQGQSKFAFIVVGILPPNVSAKDLWIIEAGIQLSRNVQLDYGPINELLKFKEGMDAGLSAIEIADAIYGGFKEEDIKNKLEEYKLISQYLEFIHESGNFIRAKGIHEHFIDLRKILANFKKDDPAPNELVDATYIGFQLIHDGVPARDFRKMKDILSEAEVRGELWEALKYSKAEPAATKRKKRRDAEDNGGHTEARVVFNNCVDSLNARKDAQNPENQLRRALKNLKAINPDHSALSESKIIAMIDDAIGVLNDLRSRSRTS